MNEYYSKSYNFTLRSFTNGSLYLSKMPLSRRTTY